MVPRRGVAIHINAFNFPSWGLWEKAAVSLLAGVPVLAKPASATALLAHAMVRDVIAAKVLPDGALSLLCGGAGESARCAHLRRRHRLHRLGRHRGARARPRQRGGQERAGQHRGRQHQRGAAGAGCRAGQRRVRCLRARGRARDDGEGGAEMHRHPPHLRAGGQGRRGCRGARGQAQGHQGRRPAPGRHPHGAGGHARPAGRRLRRHPATGGRSRGRVRRRRCARPRRHRQEQVGLRGADLAASSRTPAPPRPCTRSRCSVRPPPSCRIATSRTPAR